MLSVMIKELFLLKEAKDMHFMGYLLLSHVKTRAK